MKIYPKIRKLQSGGQLHEVNFYPTVQYTPTSNVAITQGAWSPLKQTLTPDAVLDPDILKDAKGLSNEQSKFIRETNETLTGYNRLSEPEKKSNRGQSMLAALKSDLARVNELNNNAKRNEEARGIVKDNKALDLLSTDEKGNVGVLTYKKDTNGNLIEDDIEYIDPSLIGTGLHRPLTNKQVTTYRGTLDNTVDRKILDDLVTNTKGREFADKSLEAFAKTGKDQMNSEIEKQFGIYHKDNLIKAQTIGQGTLSNIYQLSVASDVALRTLPQDEERGLKSEALQKLFDPNNRGSFSAYVRSDKGPVKSETSFDVTRKELYDLSGKVDAETDPSKKVSLMKEKSQKIKKFQNDYVRSYIQSYFNSKQDLSTDYKETYENLSGDLYNKLGSGFDALQKSEATYDVKALEGHITSHMDDVAVTSDGTVNGTVHSSRVTKLLETDKPVSSNIAFGEDKQPILLYDYSNDPKAKLFVNNTETIRGIAKSKFGEDVQKNMFRVGAGEATYGYFKKDNEGKFYNITGETVVKGSNPPKKFLDLINENKERIKETVIKNKGTDADFDTQFKGWLSSQKIINPPTPLFKIVTLVPIDSKNPYDQRLLKGSSQWEEALSETEKQAVSNRLTALKNQRTNKDKLVDWKRFDDDEFTLNDKTYKVVVREMTGMAASFAVINDISKGYGQTPDLNYNGNIESIDRQRQTSLDELLPSDLSYYQEPPKEENGGELPTLAEGGLVPRFIPQEIKIKPLSLKDLY